MGLVYEKHVARLKTAQDRGYVTHFFKRRTGSYFKLRVLFAFHKLRECSFAEASLPVKKQMVDALASFFGRVNDNFYIFLDLILAHILFPSRGSTCLVKR